MKGIFARQDLVVSGTDSTQFPMLIASAALDIVVVESPSDLNVYTSTNDDGTAKEAAENGCCVGETISQGNCCPETCCEGEHSTTKPCCSSVNTLDQVKDVARTGGTGCCSTVAENKEDVDMSDVRDIDLNKWAGSFKIYAVKP